jgi:hypothetical protein
VSGLPPSRAYSFESDLDLAGLRAALAARGDLEWHGGDNDSWGDYLVARLRDRSSKLRLFADGDRYVLDISHVPELAGTMPRGEIVDLVEREILPAIHARDVRPHSGWE